MRKPRFFVTAFVLLLIAHFTLTIENCMSQWLRQDVPVDASTVYDLKFFDANYGLISTNPLNIYRTTNCGNNWILMNIHINIQQMQIIDSLTLYGCGATTGGNGVIYRTYNKGQTWDSVAISSAIYTGISFINKDTGWISAWASGPVIYRTTNGGQTLTLSTNQVGYGNIFFLKYRINGEYYGWANQGGVGVWRNTNTGNNWVNISAAGSLDSIIFINEFTGWQLGHTNAISVTTNGGYNWIYVSMPNNNGVIGRDINFIDIIKNDTLHGSGGTRQIQNNTGLIFRGIIWKSTDKGFTWNFQQPDTAIPYTLYGGIHFIDSVNGWSSNLHTANAGGPCFTTDIHNNNSEIPDKIELKQNYPNPFNPSTTFEFSLPDDYVASLRIYDVTGRVITWAFIGFYFEKGYHKFTMYDFYRLNPSSGIYFYQLELTDKITHNLVYKETKKMLYLK